MLDWRAIFTKKRSIVPLIVSSHGLTNGRWDAMFGAASKQKIGPMPTISIPLKWTNAPKETVCFAITVIDYDAIPVLGMPWVHWLVTNIPKNISHLPPNASTTQKDQLLQGKNSFSNDYILPLKELETFQVPRKDAIQFGGFVPVGFPHRYTVTVYALNQRSMLSHGFMLNELMAEIAEHVVSSGTLSGIYDATVVPLPR
ncbi:MAG: YbhB/YbcL family Raf kinase inhibitor-like protein, partial [Bacilli bacterium]